MNLLETREKLRKLKENDAITYQQELDQLKKKGTRKSGIITSHKGQFKNERRLEILAFLESK